MVIEKEKGVNGYQIKKHLKVTILITLKMEREHLYAKMGI